MSSASSAERATTEVARGSPLDVTVRRGDAVECTITNTAKALATQVSPVLECVILNDGRPDIAVWGYNNESGSRAVVPVGGTTGRLANYFTPGDPNAEGQPGVFENGRHVGVFQTPFDADDDLVGA